MLTVLVLRVRGTRRGSRSEKSSVDNRIRVSWYLGGISVSVIFLAREDLSSSIAIISAHIIIRAKFGSFICILTFFLAIVSDFDI